MVKQRTLAKLGNKTRYGHIVSASSTIFDEDHNPLVRAGDKAWCDVCKGAFEINATYTGLLEAGFIAGDGDLVLCNCKDNFVIAMSGFTGERHPGMMSAKSAAAAVPLVQQAQQEPEQHAQTAKKKTGIDAGFAVLPYGDTTEAWQRQLFTENPPAGAKELFATLNGADKSYKAGSIMLLVDPDKQDDEQIAHMKAAKARIDVALAPLTHEEANLLHKH
ncbi:PAAR domain-containing protein [Erwinia typographi]|uniref:PAAR domain-containing protein n=1 Tax=Erwinia typographi TaxID=371042 RepID=UPI000AF36E56|nr:PAAR domain-containing protein [Erwinia typographi]